MTIRDVILEVTIELRDRDDRQMIESDSSTSMDWIVATSLRERNRKYEYENHRKLYHVRTYSF